MSTRRKAPVIDPAQIANKRILKDREERIQAEKDKETLATNLGLNIQPEKKESDDPVEFLRDEFDRKTFGEAFPTYTRLVYGPSELLTNFPDVRERIEEMGLERYAELTAETIRLKGEKAVPNPMMQRGLRAAIRKFGIDRVAETFRAHIMAIPVQTVEVEADRSDAMIFAQPMEEAVQRYGSPGMRAKFLSDRCIGVLGLRGYQIVKDEHGDPVKVGTLIMGEIPIRMAEARQRHFAKESEDAVLEAQEEFEDAAERAIYADGAKGAGFSVLGARDRMTPNASENEDLIGKTRDTGFRVEKSR
jgi:hypothetical protein